MASAAQVVEKARLAFQTGRTKSIEWRLAQLKKMSLMVNENVEEFYKAGYADMHKPKFEVEIGELSFVRSEIAHALNNLRHWMKPTTPSRAMSQMLDTIAISSEPYGVALVIGAWNYPIHLSLLPVIGAIAAGNAVVLKPSEVAPNAAKLLTKLIPKYMDNECFQVFNGGVPETTELLKQRFDYIFYTGSPPVGKIVMRAAAEHLTPVTLELGGKSPVYVNKDSNIPLVAKRIMWGKYFNMGQTCTAPDYVLCDQSVCNELVSEMKKSLTAHFGEDIKQSNDYARVISDRHFKRLKKVIDDSAESKILIGGKNDESQLYIDPTLIEDDFEGKGPVMQDEMFGPVLGLIRVENVDAAIAFINKNEKPLAMYLFSRNHKIIDKIVSSTSAGGITVNDTMMHNANSNLPFGGVGNSGTGSYHGKYSFDTFSHMKPIQYRKQNMDIAIAGRYPPYTESKQKQMVWLTEEKSSSGCSIQ